MTQITLTSTNGKDAVFSGPGDGLMIANRVDQYEIGYNLGTRFEKLVAVFDKSEIVSIVRHADA